MTEQNIPYGYCHCGCGQLAPIATRNRHSRGQIKGEPVRYIPNHFKNIYPPLEDRYWANVLKTSTCWLWTAGKTKAGYGEITIGEKTLHAHRLSYEWHKGKIDKGLHVCHACDNPSCVNPDHLFLGTPKDNHQDMHQKNRGVNPPRHPGMTHHAARLTDDDVREIRKRFTDGQTYAEIGKAYSCTPDHIGLIIRRKTWRHLE